MNLDDLRLYTFNIITLGVSFTAVENSLNKRKNEADKEL